ncbi:DUF3883 domain-containing protein [Vibrio alginolyticus]|nr:DUF3883 domain-containing protein [Vibrio alginolyticus]
MKITKKIIKKFLSEFDENDASKALASRGDFLRKFPLESLSQLSLDDYVIGKGTASFCAMVEAKTKGWANIQGATASKFGIYYGKKKGDPHEKYRPSKKFGSTPNEAFASIKKSLVDLIELGEKLDFKGIDQNPFSQMFKAKILSLYFPESYINICSEDHILDFAQEFGLPDDRYISEYQHLIIKEKLSNPDTKEWSNPKFMSFLYSQFSESESSVPNITKPRKKPKRKVNFEDIVDNQNRIGLLSENYALEWEKNRLIGLGLGDLVKEIKNRTEYPAYGYDFLSYSKPGIERYIEVKSIGKKSNGQYRFFLSDNEMTISKSSEHKEEYYFYLVKYGKDGTPVDLYIKKATEMYEHSNIEPCAYSVNFELSE